MSPSKYLVASFVENLSLIELQRFKKSILIPQNAKNLLEAAEEAEKILIKKSSSKKVVKESQVPVEVV